MQKQILRVGVAYTRNWLEFRLTPEAAGAIKAAAWILVVGAQGSGKTSFLEYLEKASERRYKGRIFDGDLDAERACALVERLQSDPSWYRAGGGVVVDHWTAPAQAWARVAELAGVAVDLVERLFPVVVLMEREA